MSDIVLSNKAQKLMKLCEIEGFDTLDDLLRSCRDRQRMSGHLHD